MNIFNSLGSNYDLNFAFKSLFGKVDTSSQKKLKQLLEQKYCGKAILTYKGREAIELALETLDLPENSFVAINGFTCFAVYKAVDTAGFFAEILDLDNYKNLNFSSSLLEKKLKDNPKIKVVIIQNTFGYPCDIKNISDICKENNIILIEDLAHSVGAIYANGKEAGTVGDFVCLSFSQDKVVDAVSGGALIIRNKKYQSFSIKKFNEISKKQQIIDRLYPLLTYKIRTLYRVGLGQLFHFTLKKLNLLSKPMNNQFYRKYGLPNWHALRTIDCFKNLKENLIHRKEIANIYKKALNNSLISNYINNNLDLSTNLRYPIFVDSRKSLIKYLKEQGVYVADIWYDDVSKEYPNSKIAAAKILNLPTHKNISKKDAKKLAEKINIWLQLQ